MADRVLTAEELAEILEGGPSASSVPLASPPGVPGGSPPMSEQEWALSRMAHGLDPLVPQSALMPPVEPAPIPERVLTAEQLDEILYPKPEEYYRIRPTTRDPLRAFMGGLAGRGSLAGDIGHVTGIHDVAVAAGRRFIDPEMPSVEEFYDVDPEGLPAKVAGGVGHFAGRLPYYMGAGRLLKAGRAGAPTAARHLGELAGTFGIGDVASETVAQLTREGGVHDPAAIAREGAWGAATGAAIWPARFARRPLSNYLAEVAGLTGVGALQAREMPDVEDAAVNAAIIGILRGSRIAGRRPGVEEGKRKYGYYQSLVTGWRTGQLMRSIREGQRDPVTQPGEQARTNQAIIAGVEGALRGDTQYSAMLWEFMDPKLRARHQEALRRLEQAESLDQARSATRTLEAIEGEVAEQVGQFRADYQAALASQARGGREIPAGARGRQLDPEPLIAERNQLETEMRTGRPDEAQIAEIDRRIRELDEQLRDLGVDPTQLPPAIGGGDIRPGSPEWIADATGRMTTTAELAGAPSRGRVVPGERAILPSERYTTPAPGLYDAQGREIPPEAYARAAEDARAGRRAREVSEAAGAALDAILRHQELEAAKSAVVPGEAAVPPSRARRRGLQIGEMGLERQARDWARSWTTGETTREGGPGRRAARRYATQVLGWTNRQVRAMTSARLADVIQRGITPSGKPSLARRLHGGPRGGPPKPPPPAPPAPPAPKPADFGPGGVDLRPDQPPAPFTGGGKERQIDKDLAVRIDELPKRERPTELTKTDTPETARDKIVQLEKAMDRVEKEWETAEGKREAELGKRHDEMRDELEGLYDEVAYRFGEPVAEAIANTEPLPAAAKPEAPAKPEAKRLEPTEAAKRELPEEELGHKVEHLVDDIVGDLVTGRKAAWMARTKVNPKTGRKLSGKRALELAEAAARHRELARAKLENVEAAYGREGRKQVIAGVRERMQLPENRVQPAKPAPAPKPEKPAKPVRLTRATGKGPTKAEQDAKTVGLTDTWKSTIEDVDVTFTRTAGQITAKWEGGGLIMTPRGTGLREQIQLAEQSVRDQLSEVAGQKLKEQVEAGKAPGTYTLEVSKGSDVPHASFGDVAGGVAAVKALEKAKAQAKAETKPDDWRLKEYHWDRTIREANDKLVYERTKAVAAELRKRRVEEDPGLKLPAPVVKLARQLSPMHLAAIKEGRVGFVDTQGVITSIRVPKSSGDAVYKWIRGKGKEWFTKQKVDPVGIDDVNLPKGEYYMPSKTMARQLEYEWHRWNDAKGKAIPMDSPLRGDKPKIRSLPGDDPRYAMGRDTEGRIHTGEFRGAPWITNGHYALSIPKEPPKGSLIGKEDFVDVKKATRPEGDPAPNFPNVEGVLPPEGAKPGETLRAIGAKIADTEGEARFGKIVYLEAQGDPRKVDSPERAARSGAMVAFNNDYYNLVEQTWPGGTWHLYAPKKGEKAPKPDAEYDKPVAYWRDGKVRAAVMPFHYESGLNAAMVRNQVEAHIDSKVGRGRDSSDVGPGGSSLGAAWYQDPVFSQSHLPGMSSPKLKAEAKRYKAKLPEPGKPRVLTADELAALDRQIADGNRLFGKQATSKLRKYRKACMACERKAQKRVAAQTRQRQGKGKLADLKDTSVKVPEEGLALSDAERSILTAENVDFNADAATMLGKDGLIKDAADFGKLSRAHKVVHLTRRVRRAEAAKHIDNILTSEKYSVWKLPTEDLEAVLTVVGDRFRGIKFEGLPKAIQRAVDQLAEGDRPGIASGLARGKTDYIVALAPARSALRNKGVLEDAELGMRGAEEAHRLEWNFMTHVAERFIFRNAKNRTIHTGSRDSAVIFNLWNNHEGHKKYIDRPTVTMQTDGPRGRWKKGEVIKPEEHQRRAARLLVELFENLADRQGLLPDMRRTYYAPHMGPVDVLRRVMDLTPAKEADFAGIHKAAKKALGDQVDVPIEGKPGETKRVQTLDAVARLLPSNLSRSKALQIRDALVGRKPKRWKTAKRMIETVLTVDERIEIPDKLRQPFLDPRRGGEFAEDAVQSFEAYLRYALRKIHLEPTVNHIKPIIEGMGESKGAPGSPLASRRYFAEKWVEHILGRPAFSDALVEGALEHLAHRMGNKARLPVIRSLFKPRPMTRLTGLMNRYQYFRLLGLALDSALTNMTQGVNTMARFGVGRGAAGYFRLFADPRNLAAPWTKRMYYRGHRVEADLLKEFHPFFTGPDPRHLYKKPLTTFEKVALSPFQVAEWINRGAAYMAGLSEARRQGLSFERSVKLGMGKVNDFIADKFPEHFRETHYTSEAEWHAKRGVIETQFGYSPVESAPMFGSPSGRVMLQFWNYPTQQAAFLYDGLRGKLAPSTYGRLRFLALLGFSTVVADQLAKRVFGLDVTNLWSLKGILPRGPGPNVLLAWYLMNVVGPGDDWAAEQKFRQEYVDTGGAVIPRGVRKQLGLSHKQLPPAPSGWRSLPVRPVQPEDTGRGSRRGRSSRGGR